MMNVWSGGRKKKLKQATPKSEAKTAGFGPQAVATKTLLARTPTPLWWDLYDRQKT